MAAQIPHLRVIHLAQNQGKALRLKPELPRRKVNIWCALMRCVIRPRCGGIYCGTDVVQPRVGAVTGNPRIRTRSTLVGKFRLASIPQLLV